MNASPFRLLVVLGVFAGGSALLACGSTSSTAESPGDGGASSKTTPPPDGAEGVCCAVSMGGCAYQGGYAKDANSCKGQFCDGMCQQHIVKGDHGCDTLDYTPCSNQGVTPDSGTCAYSPALNDPRCPTSYSHSLQDQPCAPLGLRCAYPGAGDAQSDGCFATAMTFCQGDGGMGDAAADAGAGTWTTAQ